VARICDPSVPWFVPGVMCHQGIFEDYHAAAHCQIVCVWARCTLVNFCYAVLCWSVHPLTVRSRRAQRGLYQYSLDK